MAPVLTADAEIAELRAEITAVETDARTKKEAVDADRNRLRDEGVNMLTSDRFEEFDQRYKEADTLKERAAELRRREAAALAGLASRTPGQIVDGPPLNREERRQFASIAKRYLGSDAYKRLRESGVLKSDGSRISHDPVEVMSRGEVGDDGVLRSELIDGIRSRTTVNVGDAGAVVPIDQQVWPPVLIPVRKIKVLDLISMTTTESDVVNFTKQTVRADFAAETPYGTVAPEADYEFALQQVSVKRIPTFIPATKDILADRGELQPLLQEQLMMGVRLRLEAQVLAGTGTSFSDANLQGMLQATGIGSVTYQSAGHTTEYQLDAYHRAMTTIRLSLFADPQAQIIHPIDFEWALLKKDTQGRYILPQLTETALDTIWGLQTVVTPLITQGLSLVGDFKQAYRLWLRSGLTVTASTEHQDFFTRGMVAMLAEMRCAGATIQPRALCQVTALTGP